MCSAALAAARCTLAGAALRRADRGACSCGVAVVPMGVARWRIGSGGRLPGPMLEPRGFTFGDGMRDRGEVSARR